MRVLLGGTLLIMAVGVAACGGSEEPKLDAAPSARDPGCTSLLSRLPSTVLGRAKGSTDVAGAAVWGQPPIVLRCGVTPPAPSADACINVDDVDWLFTEKASSYVFTTYGRTPATELTVPHEIDRTQAAGAMAQLSPAVKPLPSTRHCVGPDNS
jgi:hypothetical protein